jgi:hypothetical protein
MIELVETSEAVMRQRLMLGAGFAILAVGLGGGLAVAPVLGIANSAPNGKLTDEAAADRDVVTDYVADGASTEPSGLDVSISLSQMREIAREEAGNSDRRAEEREARLRRELRELESELREVKSRLDINRIY